MNNGLIDELTGFNSCVYHYTGSNNANRQLISPALLPGLYIATFIQNSGNSNATSFYMFMLYDDTLTTINHSGGADSWFFDQTSNTMRYTIGNYATGYIYNIVCLTGI